MNYYRITKYNPALRDNQGNYTANDWTSISDIGRTFDDGILSAAKYQQIENAYVKAVSLILKENEISKLTICGLEKNDGLEEYLFSSEEKSFYAKLIDNFCVELDKIDSIIRFALRELIWCTLSDNTSGLEIKFGYDYYMYIKCNNINASIEKMILDNGLFVEPMTEMGYDN